MKSKKAFTLIELLIVIAIIGILAAVIFVSLNSARKKAQDAQVKSDMTSLSQALEIVKVDRSLSPIAWTALTSNAPLGTAPLDDTNIARWLDGGGTSAAPVGNALVTKLPVSPITDAAIGQTYLIRIINTNGYSILGRLNAANNYYCVVNGAGSIVTGNLNQAKAACAAI